MSEAPSAPSLTVTVRLDATPALLVAIGTLTQAIMSLSAGSSAAVPSAPPLPEAPVPVVPKPSVASVATPPAKPEALAPKAASSGKPAKAAAPLSWRTPERAAVLRRRYPAGDPMPEIRAELNTLPGAVFTTKQDVAQWAFNLGLRRPAGTPNPFRGPAASVVAPSPKPETDAEPDPVAPPKPAPLNPVEAAPQPAVAEPKAAAPLNPGPAKPVPLKPAPLNPVEAVSPRAPLIQSDLRGPEMTRRAVAREGIESWCLSRGWRFDKFDIDAINRRCAGIGHPGFTVLEPSRRGVGGL